MDVAEANATLADLLVSLEHAQTIVARAKEIRMQALHRTDRFAESLVNGVDVGDDFAARHSRNYLM